MDPTSTIFHSSINRNSYQKSSNNDLVPGLTATKGLIHTADTEIESGGVNAASDQFLLSSNRRYNVHEGTMSIYIPIVVDGLYINRLEPEPEPEPLQEFSYYNYKLAINSLYDNNLIKLVKDCSNVIINSYSFTLKNEITVLFKNS